MTSNPEPIPDELAVVYARMSGLLLSEHTVATVLELITSLAKDTLPGSAGAGGVTLFSSDATATTSAATDPIVEHLDALQYELGQGPCLSAAQEQVVVRVDDLTTERRWSQWSARAAAEGMRLTVSAPLNSAGRPPSARSRPIRSIRRPTPRQAKTSCSVSPPRPRSCSPTSTHSATPSSSASGSSSPCGPATPSPRPRESSCCASISTRMPRCGGCSNSPGAVASPSSSCRGDHRVRRRRRGLRSEDAVPARR